MQNPLEEEYVSTLSSCIEQEYQLHPVIFNIKLGLLSLLGYLLIFSYCFIPALIGVFLCLAVLSLVNGSSVELLLESLKFSIFIILFSILFHRNPFKKLYQIEGYELTAQEFPVLFAEFDQLSQKRKAPRIHTIVLEHSRNARVTRMPRFTFLGWNKNTLSLGIEYLFLMSPEQMRSVLAHEWGHLSNKKESFAVRIGLILIYIEAFCGMLENYHLDRFLRFFYWFRFTLTHYQRVLMRSNELLADAAAMDLAGKNETIEGLLKCSVFGLWLDRYYWQPLFDLTRILPEPIASPYKNLQAFLQEYKFVPDELDITIKQVLLQKSGPLTTHPSLNARLTALDIKPSMLELTQLYAAKNWFGEKPDSSVAEAWFGEKLDSVIAYMDREWQQEVTPCWGKYHQSHQKPAEE